MRPTYLNLKDGVRKTTITGIPAKLHMPRVPATLPVKVSAAVCAVIPKKVLTEPSKAIEFVCGVDGLIAPRVSANCPRRGGVTPFLLGDLISIWDRASARTCVVRSTGEIGYAGRTVVKSFEVAIHGMKTQVSERQLPIRCSHDIEK
jgi:hypothetical protein